MCPQQCPQQDLNLRPSAPEADALSPELWGPGVRDKVTSTRAPARCAATQFVEATADFTRVAASADDAKAGEAALTQNLPENA